MSASPAVRGLRAAVFAVVCVLLAAAGHRLGTGVDPPRWADGAGFLGVFGAGWGLGVRERSQRGIGAVVLGTQGTLHLGFEAAAGPSAVPDAVGGGTHRHLARTSRLLGGAVEHAHEMLTPVTAAHLLAALVAAWWLRRGEAAVWGLLRQAADAVPPAGGLWRLAVPVALPASPGGAPRASVRLGMPRQALLRHSVTGRGPPRWVPYVN
jgi:hypothetical protein